MISVLVRIAVARQVLRVAQLPPASLDLVIALRDEPPRSLGRDEWRLLGEVPPQRSVTVE